MQYLYFFETKYVTRISPYNRRRVINSQKQSGFFAHPVLYLVVVAGYLANIWKLDDLIVLVHCPESPKLPTLSLKSTVYIRLHYLPV